MHIFDQNFKRKPFRYIFQCFLAIIVMLIVLTFLDVLTHTAIIASLGATFFIVFTMPHSYLTKTRHVVGGYAVGILVGCLCHLLSSYTVTNLLFVTPRLSYIVFGALAVGAAILTMVITDTEHAPAAGIALGLVLNRFDYLTIIFIFCTVICLSIIRKLLKPFLIDLI